MEPVVAPVENVVASVETGVAPMGIVVAAPVLDELEGCGVLDVGSLRMKGVVAGLPRHVHAPLIHSTPVHLLWALKAVLLVR